MKTLFGALFIFTSFLTLNAFADDDSFLYARGLEYVKSFECKVSNGVIITTQKKSSDGTLLVSTRSGWMVRNFSAHLNPSTIHFYNEQNDLEFILSLQIDRKPSPGTSVTVDGLIWPYITGPFSYYVPDHKVQVPMTCKVQF